MVVLSSAAASLADLDGLVTALGCGQADSAVAAIINSVKVVEECAAEGPVLLARVATADQAVALFIIVILRARSELGGGYRDLVVVECEREVGKLFDSVAWKNVSLSVCIVLGTHGFV